MITDNIDLFVGAFHTQIKIEFHFKNAIISINTVQRQKLLISNYNSSMISYFIYLFFDETVTQSSKPYYRTVRFMTSKLRHVNAFTNIHTYMKYTYARIRILVQILIIIE